MLNRENSFDLNWQFPHAGKYVFVFLTLFITLIIIYGNSFDCSFHFDDTPNILKNPNVQAESLNWEELSKSFYGTDLNHNKISRPLSYLSLAVNYHFNGENVFWYHVVNFSIHLITSIFLFLLIFNTLQLPLLRDRYQTTAYAISLLAVFFWATHPIQLTAVTYIVQRMAAMAGMFYVMAMYFYLKGRTSSSRGRQVIMFCSCVITALFAFASKENAAMLPVSLFFFEFFLIQGASLKKIKKFARLAVIPILVFAALAFFYVDFSSFLNGYETRPFTLAQRLMTEPRIIMFYISLLFYPVGSRFTLIHDIPVSHSLIDPWSTAASIIFIMAAMIAAFGLSRKFPLIAFCVIFYFINHFIESSIIPLELIYEHRNYIPSMFFFVLTAFVVVSLLDYFSYRSSIQFFMAVSFCFLLAAQAHTTSKRNEIWKNDITLWSDNSIKTPNVSRVHTNLGKAYSELGIHSEAKRLFRRALRLNRVMRKKGLAVLLHNAGLASFEENNDEAALNYFKQALEINPKREDTLTLLCKTYLAKGMLNKAYLELQGRVSDISKVRSAQLMQTYALVMYHSGKAEKAIALAEKALQINPYQSDTFPILAQSFTSLGQKDKAERYWQRYLQMNPENIEAHLALTEFYAKTKNKIKLFRITEDLFLILKRNNLCNVIADEYVHNNLRKAYIPDISSIKEGLKRVFDEKYFLFLECNTY